MRLPGPPNTRMVETGSGAAIIVPNDTGWPKAPGAGTRATSPRPCPDGPGTNEEAHVRRQLRLLIAVAATTALLIAPATVWAIDRFTDVPDSNVFHDDISWLADAGVTLGCNPPSNDRFCPDSNVTRAQMAAFMRRLAENQVVDAATLDGLDSTEIAPMVYTQTDTDNGGTTETASGRVEINSIAIDVPVDGYLVITGGVFINNQSGADQQFALNAMLDGTDVQPQDWTVVTSFETGTEQNRGNLGYTATVAVSAGSHTVSQEAGPYSGTANFFHNQENLTVVFYPGNVVTPAGLGLAGDAGGSPQG